MQLRLLSVTVIAPDCTTADAFATAFMVLGRTNTAKIIHFHPELEAWLLYDENGKYKIEHIEPKQIMD